MSEINYSIAHVIKSIYTEVLNMYCEYNNRFKYIVFGG